MPLENRLEQMKFAPSATTAAIVVAVGYALQLIFGNVDLRWLAWPVNGLVCGSLVMMCAATAFFAENRAAKFITSMPLAVSLLAALAILSLIMGLTPQGATPAGGVAAAAARLGLNSMTSSWPFVLIYAALLVSLGATVARRLAQFRITDAGFLLSHLGLWIVLTAAGLGSADLERFMVRVDEGAATNMGQESASGMPRRLPVTVALHDFVMEEWAPASPGAPMKPKSYTSEITLTSPAGDSLRGVTSVNHPLKFAGVRAYQYGYDRQAGPASTYSVIELVGDSWLWPVYVGFALIALGALLMIWRGRVVFAVTVLAAGSLYLLMDLMRPDTPSTRVPALQSIWFVPHVAAYIVAYTLMMAATVGAIYQLVRMGLRREADSKAARMIDKFVYAGLGMLTAGMLMGAVWAKEAWGHYWEWDPKETWALVTILAYLCYVHLREIGPRRQKTALWLLIVAFVALMITWQGVNYLPSAQSSIHVY